MALNKKVVPVMVLPGPGCSSLLTFYLFFSSSYMKLWAELQIEYFDLLTLYDFKVFYWY